MLEWNNSLVQWSPIFLALGTGFMDDNFSKDGGVGGMVLWWSKLIIFRVHDPMGIQCGHWSDRQISDLKGHSSDRQSSGGNVSNREWLKIQMKLPSLACLLLTSRCAALVLIDHWPVLVWGLGNPALTDVWKKVLWKPRKVEANSPRWEKGKLVRWSNHEQDYKEEL